MQSQHFLMLQINIDEFSQPIAESQANTAAMKTRKRHDNVKLQPHILAKRLASLLMLVSFAQMVRPSDTARLPDIYWNSSNPIFRIDNTDHIFDVNRKPNDHDQVDLVCPQQQLADGANKTEQSSERYIIYSVSREEYDTCRLATPNANNAGGGQSAGGARVVAVCDQTPPGKPQRPPFTVTFRSFTPQPNGLEFKPGQDYYFITALIGHNQDPAKRFSPCRELNMKVIFKVCCKSSSSVPPGNSQQQQQSSQTPVTSGIVVPRNKPANVPVSSTSRRPAHINNVGQAVPVLTLRPSLTAAPKAGASEFGAGQQQPITVLPIEVLQPASSESSADGELFNNGASSSSTTSTASPMFSAGSVADSERNDIVQNEQPGISSYGAPGARTVPFNNQQQQQQQQARARQPGQAPPSFLPFDPRAAPEVLRADYGRWAPTPLPPRLTAGSPTQLGRSVQHQQQQQPPAAPAFSLAAQANEPAPWRLPPLPRPPLQRQALSAADGQQQKQQQQAHHHQPMGAQSRMSLYPHAVWSTYDQQTAGPARDLITVQDQFQQQQQQHAQGGGSAANVQGAPTFALALLVPLFALAILLALGLERRLR